MSDTTPEPTLVIRRARPDDAAALARVAELDDARVPAGPLLVGEVGGRIWVAVSLVSREDIADPYQRSGEIAGLVRERARQLRGDPRPSARGWRWRRRAAVRQTFVGGRP
jgi:hypothetical protein